MCYLFSIILTVSGVLTKNLASHLQCAQCYTKHSVLGRLTLVIHKDGNNEHDNKYPLLKKCCYTSRLSW